MYRALAVDIDGTLTNRDKQITSTTVSELRRVANLGVQIIFASSRMPRSIARLMAEIGIAGHVVAYNGALVQAFAGAKEVLHNDPLNAGMLLRVQNGLFGLVATGLHVGLFFEDQWIASADDYWTARESRTNRIAPDEFGLESAITDMLKHRRGPHKVMLRGEPTIVDAGLGILQCDGVATYRPKGNIAELTSAQSTKAGGVSLLLNRIDVPNTSLVAMGDNLNDLGMIELAGLGVAMGNAPEALRQVADQVTTSNDAEGVAIALRRLF